MKNVYWLFILFFIISSDCLAITLSQPVKIGEIIYRGGLDLRGATSIKDFSTVKRPGIYDRGVASFQ